MTEETGSFFDPKQSTYQKETQRMQDTLDALAAQVTNTSNEMARKKVTVDSETVLHMRQESLVSFMFGDETDENGRFTSQERLRYEIHWHHELLQWLQDAIHLAQEAELGRISDRLTPIDTRDLSEWEK